MGPSLYEPLAAVYRPPEGVPLEWEVLVRSRPYGLTVLVGEPGLGLPGLGLPGEGEIHSREARGGE